MGDKRDLYKHLLDFLKDGDCLEDACKDKELAAVLRQLDQLSQLPCRPDKNRMWINICGNIRGSRRRKLVRRWSAVAAVLIPVLMGVVLFFHFQPYRTEPHFMPETVARNQVRLHLNDGRVLSVQQMTKDSVLYENGVGIWVDTASRVVYTPQDVQNVELVYNTLVVPRCCEYRMVLPDGTWVWLNSESELRFPVHFTGDERRVFLKGEAYFQVARDLSKPFRVEAGALEIEALGTQFDVNAYRDSDRLMATLVEGRVRVSASDGAQSCVLESGKQALFRDNLLTTSEVDVAEVTAWKEGRFMFRNMTMEDIARQLERWYDVEIGFPDVMVRYYRFTGVMKRYNSLSQLLEMIAETTDVKFQVYGRKVEVCRR